jgi:hypothetical protein
MLSEGEGVLHGGSSPLLVRGYMEVFVVVGDFGHL